MGRRVAFFVKCVQFVNSFFGNQNRFISWTNGWYRDKIYLWVYEPTSFSMPVSAWFLGAIEWLAPCYLRLAELRRRV